MRTLKYLIVISSKLLFFHDPKCFSCFPPQGDRINIYVGTESIALKEIIVSVLG